MTCQFLRNGIIVCGSRKRMSKQEAQSIVDETEMIGAAQTFIERLRKRAENCTKFGGLPILARGFSNAAMCLQEDLNSQIRALRDDALGKPSTRSGSR